MKRSPTVHDAVPGPKNLTVRRTHDLADNLAVLTSAVQHDGSTTSATAAVHRAVQLLADAYRRAWDYGDVPDGTAPDVIAVRYRTADGEPEPMPIVHGWAAHDTPAVHTRTTHVVQAQPLHDGTTAPRPMHDATVHDSTMRTAGPTVRTRTAHDSCTP